ncbi:hypothetical protein N8261_05200 [Flavobacteriaceae bacterium]|nr:hypothetical protein [Flavobacteriaceae bacterium]
MSNFFEEVLDDAKNVEQKILGPDYEYWKQIKSPSQMGMSTNGSMSTIAKDVGGLINYVELLVTGQGGASKTGRPLGDKFFLKTAATCKDKPSGGVVDRYIYVNNVPDGNIPFISGASGMNFSTFEGLVPGTLSNLSAMNPLLIFQAFVSGSQPDCQEIELETIDVNNKSGTETRHVTVTDIQNMGACNFPGNKNPISGRRCKEAFTNRKRTQIPDDFLVKMFYSGLGVIGVYLLISIMKRIKERK